MNQSKMPHATKQAQQGDCLFMSVNQLPKDCKERTGPNRLTIALGEKSGHHHTFEDDGNTCIMDAPDGQIFVVKKPVQELRPIKHQEHKPFTLEPKIWRYEPVQEKDWFTDMVRPASD